MKSTTRLHSAKREQLGDRWNGQIRSLSGNSPFGATAAGLQDFRAFSFPDVAGTFNPLIVGQIIKDADLSYANLNNTSIESCKFENCMFGYSTLHNVSFVKCKFSRCFFFHTDFRAAGIGVYGAEIDSCEFVRPKLARASFHLVKFANIDFDGKDWSFVNFGISDFWNCTLRGMFRRCEFQNRLREEEAIKLAKTEGLGFHNVDLSAAEFFLSGFPPNFVFNNVRMPQSQSAQIVKVGKLRTTRQLYEVGSQQDQILLKYLEMFVPNAPSNQERFVSKHDLLDLGDPSAATDVFSQLALE